MYRRTPTLLWTGTAFFLALAVIDAMLDFMGHMQGVFIGAMAACFVSVWLHKLNETATMNRRKSEQLQEDVETKSQQLSCNVDRLNNEVVQLKALVRAKLIKDASEREDNRDQDNAETSTEAQDAIVYQFRLRHPDGHDVIVGKRTREPIDNADELLAALDANDTGTLPGRFSAS